MSPNSISCTSWLKAHPLYNWTVDLSTYKKAHRYPEHFDMAVHPDNLREFEGKFRETIDDEDGSYIVAGEVVYWKLYGAFQARNRVTGRLLDNLTSPNIWLAFRGALDLLCREPTFEHFKLFQQTCDQPKGFAVPITFLSFYRSSEYPMVDKFIAYWWKDNKSEYGFEEAHVFSQRSDGWIQTTSETRTRQNWDAYLNWKDFCCKYADLISEQCNVSWRARDVEMAVWMAWKNNISLSSL